MIHNRDHNQRNRTGNPQWIEWAYDSITVATTMRLHVLKKATCECAEDA